MSRIMKKLLMIALVAMGLNLGTSHVAAGYGKKCSREKTAACDKNKKTESKKQACKCPKGKCACILPSMMDVVKAWIKANITG